MTVSITIFGFGDDRPTPFDKANRLDLELDTPTTASIAMRTAGFEDNIGLVLMINNQVVAPDSWNYTTVTNGDDLRVLAAFEGG